MQKRILSAMLIIAMIMTLFVGCSSGSTTSTTSTAATTSTSTSTAASGTSSSDSNLGTEEHALSLVDKSGDPYEVNFLYLVAQEGSDQQKVNDAVNTLTKEKLNMTVNMIPMTFGTFSTQLSMMLASNEPLDLFPAFGANYATYINSSYVVNGADYIDYCADAREILGEDADCGYVGDFLMGYGQMKERSYPAGLVIRKDLFDELGYTTDDFNVTVDDYSSFDKITEMFKKAHEKWPDMVVFDGTSTMGLQTGSYIDGVGDNFGVLENYGQTTTFSDWYESDQYKKFAEINRQWFTAGYTSQDVATNTDSGEIKLKAGNTFCYMTNVKPNTNIEKKAQTGYDVVIVPCSETMKTTANVGADVYAVANASKDKVKAWEFLNWTYTSQEFEDLINWGVEGTDWVETSDGMAAYPDGVTASSVGYHNDFGWIYPNQFVGHAWTGNPTDIWDQYKKYNASTTKSKAFGFMFDSVNVETQEEQCTSVYNQYYKDVAFGAVDVDSGISDFVAALKTAGIDDIIKEKQTQLDAYLAKSK